MKRLYLTVEGQTEAAFATSVLTPHLTTFNVFLTPPRFTGLHKRRRGRIPRGGMLNTFGHALADIKTWLKEDKSPEARFSMMVDSIRCRMIFPVTRQAWQSRRVENKRSRCKNRWRRKSGTPASFHICKFMNTKLWSWWTLGESRRSTMYLKRGLKPCARSATAMARLKTSTTAKIHTPNLGFSGMCSSTTRMSLVR